MMHSITNDRAKTDNGTKYTGIRILAVLFWIAIWQFASMYLKQEILLASPVSVIQKLFELIFSRNFWYSVGFSFVRIVTGFLLAVFLGIFLAILAYWSKIVEILTAPVITMITIVHAKRSGVFRYIFALYSFSPIEPEGTPITSAATPAFQHIPSESLHAERK